MHRGVATRVNLTRAGDGLQLAIVFGYSMLGFMGALIASVISVLLPVGQVS